MIDHVEKLMNGEKADMVFTDPPYGINVQMDSPGTINKGKILNDETTQVAVDVFNYVLTMNIPSIFWGANHYCLDAKIPNSSCWICWDKQEKNNHVDQSDGEFAWTNIKGPARIFRHLWMGFRKDSEVGERRVHPTQKPIALIEEILNFFKLGNVVLDLFGGSGSTLIACEKRIVNVL
jgi:DNA modification methylase